MRDLICICCPKGCHLQVDIENGYTVIGNACQQGAEYGRNECIAPVRIVTSTVKITDGTIARCPVKTNRPVPKEKVFDVMVALDNIQLAAPVHAGQIILRDVAGADVIATRTIEPRAK